MKKILSLVFVSALAYWLILDRGVFIPGSSLSSQGTDSTLQAAYDNRQSDLQVQGKGIVTLVLPDDLKGSRHQRFLLKLDSGQTLLIAHNIDLAPRIDSIEPGDTVEFHGEYEWNPRGGVIHWTHRDPSNRHVGGWLKHRGNTYQ